MILVLAAALIAANALFVLMEFALVRARPSRVELLARKGGRRTLAVQSIISRLDDYLAACQVGTRSSRWPWAGSASPRSRGVWPRRSAIWRASCRRLFSMAWCSP
jgi:hypothetical protein